ncbi:MAG: BON domain-containing protein, partial [Pirellulaceae bacterium]
EEVPAEEVPAEEVPAEEVRAEEVPAEEVPAEEVPAEEVPAEEVPAEEVPAATTTLPVPAIPIVKQAIDPAAPSEPELAPLLPKTTLSSTPTEEDMQIAREILKNFKGLKEAGYLHHFSIYLRVINGTAELSGELISDVQHNLLTRTVRSVAGVQAVKDLLVVKALDVEPDPQPAIPAIDEPVLESPQPQPVAAPQAEQPALAEKTPVEAAPVEEAPAATEESKVEEKDNLEVPDDTSKAPIELPNPVEEDLFNIK